MQVEDNSRSDETDLDNSFGYQLKMLQVDVDARAREALAEFDISPARVTAMIVINKNAGCTQTALGEALSINRASAMKLVNILEARGFVTRAAAPDSRANALYLTRLGDATLRKMTAALEEADRDVLSPLSPAEQEVFRAYMQRVRKGLADCRRGTNENSDEG